jgi:peptidoglycan/LPS O-acetylase OafA/YrhL
VNRSHRSIALDLLRAIAILLVLGRHTVPGTGESSPLFGSVLNLWRQGGWIGVDLFFVLSGFLVSGLLFRELKIHKHILIGQFFARRGLKIYPAFFVFILATLGVRLLMDREIRISEFVAEFAFMQNYFKGVWGYTWSLAVEEHFYLLLPLALFGCLPRGNDGSILPRRLLVLFVAVAAVCWVLRYRVAAELPFSYRTHMAPTHLRIDALLAGVLISAFYHYHAAAFQGFVRRYRIPLWLVGGAMLLPPFVLDIETNRWLFHSGLTVVYLGSACVLMAALASEPRNRVCRALAFVGAHSYSIYLWHGTSIWMRDFVERFNAGALHWGLDLTLYLTYTVGVGILMSKVVEWPVIKLRDRWFPSRAKLVESSSMVAAVRVDLSTVER